MWTDQIVCIQAWRTKSGTGSVCSIRAFGTRRDRRRVRMPRSSSEARRNALECRCGRCIGFGWLQKGAAAFYPQKRPVTPVPWQLVGPDADVAERVCIQPLNWQLG
jgi:hypothetical protein